MDSVDLGLSPFHPSPHRRTGCNDNLRASKVGCVLATKTAALSKKDQAVSKTRVPMHHRVSAKIADRTKERKSHA